MARGVVLASLQATPAGGETQTLEMDSGDWFLVRVSGLPTTAEGDLVGILRVRRQADSGQAATNEAGATATPGE